ncbi:MAG: peptidoglycan-binding protein [Erythrobacter sp.]|nr:peptidoglycan-binding protein [Erythrobacter sp.]
MSETKLAMAKLIELTDDFTSEKADGKSVEVQFNPETLKLAFANEIQQPEGGDQASGTAGQQFVGAGSTTLTVTLWFDVTAMETNPVDDVRRKTKEVLYFMTPRKFESDESKFVPPAVRFQWASLIFDGLVTSMEENLEFFSPEGKPLRANMALGFTQQKILVSDFEGDGKVNLPGTKPREQAKEGDSVQKMAAKKGKGNDWQSIAEANQIEDPLRMKPGKLVDLNAKVPKAQVKLPSVEIGAGNVDVGAGISVGPQGAAVSLTDAANAALNLPQTIASQSGASQRLGLPSLIPPPLPKLGIE